MTPRLSQILGSPEPGHCQDAPGRGGETVRDHLRNGGVRQTWTVGYEVENSGSVEGIGLNSQRGSFADGMKVGGEGVRT